MTGLRGICKTVEVSEECNEAKRPVYGSDRVDWGVARESQGVPGGQEGIQGIPLGHRVGLMSLFMIHKAYMPVYK